MKPIADLLPTSRIEPRRNLIRGWLSPVALAIAIAQSSWAQLPTIEMSRLSQAVVERGSTATLQVSGAHTDELSQLVFSHPGFDCSAQSSETPLLAEGTTSPSSFRIATENVPLGMYEVRALGRFGISNPRRLLVVDRPVDKMGMGHTDATSAFELHSGRIIQGQFLEGQKLFAQIELQRGDRLRCAVYAQPLDSRAIPAVTGLAPDGRELCRVRGLEDWPAEFEISAEDEGQYLLVLHDFLYRGGDEYSFWLETSVTNTTELHAELALDRGLRPTALTSSTVEGRLRATPSMPVSPPVTIVGSFGADPAPSFELQASAGQRWWFDVISRQRRQLTDPWLLIFERLEPAADERATNTRTGKLLAEHDDQPRLGGSILQWEQRDPSLEWTVPHDGKYRVTVRDNEVGPRPADGLGFQLEIATARPDYQLIAYRPFPSNNPAGARPLGSNLLRGGTESVEVVAVRKHGFAEAIEVVAEDLPPGVSCDPAIIPAGGNGASLTLLAAEDAPGWHGKLHLIGRARLADETLERTAAAATISWPAMPTFNAVVTRPADDLCLNVNATDTAPVTVEVNTAAVSELSQGSTTSIPVRLIRREGGDGACVLRGQNLPPKTSAAEVAVAADASQATIEFVVAADAPLGDYTFWMQTETKVKWRRNPQALTRAQQRLARLEAARQDPAHANQAEAIGAAIQSVTDEITQLTAATAPQELTLWLPSTLARVRIVPKPN